MAFKKGQLFRRINNEIKEEERCKNVEEESKKRQAEQKAEQERMEEEKNQKADKIADFLVDLEMEVWQWDIIDELLEKRDADQIVMNIDSWKGINDSEKELIKGVEKDVLERCMSSKRGIEVEN